MRKIFLFVLLSSLACQNCYAEDSPKSTVVVAGKRTPALFSNDTDTIKIFRRKELEDQARNLIKKGEYDQALQILEQALEPSLQATYYHSSIPHFLKREVYWLQGRYEDALKVLEPLLKVNSTHQPWLDERLELLALIQSRDTNSPQPLYGHIKYLREKYKDQLPPNAGAYSDIIASTIIRLYDHIGDYDQGIEFVEGFLKLCASGKTCSRDFKKFAYTIKNPFFQIKQAFLQDKSENRASCIESKRGEVCMGRATKALIESDYFPW